MMLNVLILILDYILYDEIEISTKSNDYLDRKIICLVQLTLLFIWKVILLYNYLENNGKLKRLY